VAAGNILKIKITLPPLGENILQRPLLLERLDEYLLVKEGFTRPLTLISAPAGFGKTTLARKWLADRKDRSAWYSLDERDSERERYWSYLVSALQTLQEDLGKGTQEILHSFALDSQSPSSSEDFLAPLLNDLFGMEKTLFLVLDDYHLIDSSHVHQDMAFFIENLPPTLHLIITTRSTPPWPLSRWRARGQMAEIRQRDLKFSPEETGYLFHDIKGFSLTDAQLNLLHDKTDGWITGLQLAANSLASQPDMQSFINSFAGSHRHVFHFLSEEVFYRQPEPIQDFLLQISILKRFCGPLCNAITGRKDSAEVLANLEQNHLFVFPLDDWGEWYGYHPLFADLLWHYLKKKHPEKIATLHETAANWFLKAGDPGEAVRHFLSIKKLNKAISILHDHFEEILNIEGPGLIIECLDQLPPELLKDYPTLAVQKAWFHLVHKGISEAGKYLKPLEEKSYQGQKGQGEFAGMLEVVRAYYYIYAHDFPRALENAEKALELLPSGNNYWRSKANIICGDARLFSGNPQGAYPFYQEAHRNNQAYGNLYLTLSSGFKVATTLYFLGRLDKAEELTQNLLEAAREKGFSQLPRIGLLWTLQGELLREKGELEEAERCVEQGLKLSQTEKPSHGWNLLFKIALAFSKGKFQEALRTIEHIEELHLEVGLPMFITQPTAFWKSRVLLKLGETRHAQEALFKAGIAENQEVRGGQEMGYLALAHLLELEDGTVAVQARNILEQVEQLAREGENQNVLLKTLLCKSGLEERAGNPDTAENYLVKVLSLGNSMGYFQLFVDESRKLASVYARLLGENAGQKRTCRTKEAPLENKTMIEYTRRIYLGITSVSDITTGTSADSEKPGEKTRTGETTEASNQNFMENTHHLPDLPVEELSSRELEILHLLNQGLSNRDISQKLFLSVGTVKWHTSNIYGKLGVRSRSEAVALARSLKLLT